MLRYIAAGGLIVLGLVAVCGLGIYAFMHRYDPPASWRNPPLYPGARDVRVQDFGEWGVRVPDVENTFIIKTINFEVDARPEEVKQFYFDKLQEQGWNSSDKWGRLPLAPDRLDFSWSNGARPPSIYMLDVTALPSPSDGTQVEISVSMFPGY